PTAVPSGDRASSPGPGGVDRAASSISAARFNPRSRRWYSGPSSQYWHQHPLDAPDRPNRSASAPDRPDVTTETVTFSPAAADEGATPTSLADRDPSVMGSAPCSVSTPPMKPSMVSRA